MRCRRNTAQGGSHSRTNARTNLEAHSDKVFLLLGEKTAMTLSSLPAEMDGRSKMDMRLAKKRKKEHKCVFVVRLTLRWMFETAIGNGTKQLGLEQEIAETSRVDTDVTTLLIRTTTRDCQVAFLGGSGAIAGFSRSGSDGGWLCGLELLVGVVDEIFFGGHVELLFRFCR